MLLLYSPQCAIGWLTGSKGALQRTFLTTVEVWGMEQNSSMGGGVGLGARVALVVPAGGSWCRRCRSAAALGPPGLGGSPDTPDHLPAQRPADGKNPLHLNVKPGPNGLQGTSLEVQKETTCVDVATMAETPGSAPVSIGLAVDRLSLSSPSVQISIGSCLLLGC